MHIGIVGEAGSGRTTLFAALTAFDAPSKQKAGVIKVPDLRLYKLNELYQPKKLTPAEIVVHDIMGPGEGITSIKPQHIADMRKVDLLLHVVGHFAIDPVDALQHVQRLLDELILADLTVIEKRLERSRKEQKKGREIDLLKKMAEHLESSKPLNTLDLSSEELKPFVGFAFLTLKPCIIVMNVAEETTLSETLKEQLQALTGDYPLSWFSLTATLEKEIAALPEAERQEFLKELNIEEAAQAAVIRKSYELMRLISFFTVGKDEVRAWTITQGDDARRAAGKIHSDLERGFIRAEVMRYEDVLQYGGEKGCQQAGVMRVEGKDYIVNDGEIMHVRLAFRITGFARLP